MTQGFLYMNSYVKSNTINVNPSSDWVYTLWAHFGYRYIKCIFTLIIVFKLYSTYIYDMKLTHCRSFAHIHVDLDFRSPWLHIDPYIREISLYVQRRICVDIGDVFTFKINPYWKINYTFENLLSSSYKTITLLVFRNWYFKNLNAAIRTFYTYTSLKTYNETSLLIWICAFVYI